MSYKDKERWKEYQRLRYRQHRAIGLCAHCNKKVVPGLSRCQYHCDYKRLYDEKYRHKKYSTAKANTSKEKRE